VPATAQPAAVPRSFRSVRRWFLLLLSAAALLFALNFAGLLAVPGGPLLPAGMSSNGSGADGFSGAGLLPPDQLPSHAWVANVVITNYGSSDVSLVGASLVDILPSTQVVGIYVDGTANMRCPVVTFEDACVAQAVVGGDIGVQTLAPSEETWLMVVMNAQGPFTGFRDVTIRYRSGPITYVTRLAQGAWACVGVEESACPENPWPAG
jgi:hypothetical protein